MIEPHVFCGPEFTLEIPAAYPQPLEPEVLLLLQTELYNLLTFPVRCKIHVTYGESISSAAAPPPLNRLVFLDSQSLHVKEAESDEGVVRFIILITDSRVAAELYVICLKNPFIALPFGMRLRNRYTVPGRNAVVRPIEMLQKKELLRSHMNLDEDLWKTLQEALTPEWLQEFEGQLKKQQEQKYGVGPMRESQRHEHHVESLLHYCEMHVHYAGMLNEEGNASPFLMAMGLFYHLRLTHRDAIRHFAPHPRRTIRALALFIARYTVPPEELEPFFALSLTDDVVIACTEDQHSTTAMRHLSEELLLHDEVSEAWLPTYQAYWIEHKVRPMMQRVEAERKRREELRQARLTDPDKARAGTTPTAVGAGGGREGTVLQGSGTGVGIFGFRNMRDLQAHVQEKERVLVPQRILPLSLGRRRNDEDIDDDDDDDNDDDDFLIKVRLEGRNETEMGRANHPEQVSLQQQQKQAAARKKRKRPPATFRTRTLVMTEAYRGILRLLGRTEPFDQRGEHYLKF